MSKFQKKIDDFIQKDKEQLQRLYNWTNRIIEQMSEPKEIFTKYDELMKKYLDGEDNVIINDLILQGEEIVTQLSRETEEIQRLNKEIQGLKEKIRQLNEEINETNIDEKEKKSEEIEELEQDVFKLEIEIDNLNESTKTITDEIVKLEASPSTPTVSSEPRNQQSNTDSKILQSEQRTRSQTSPTSVIFNNAQQTTQSRQRSLTNPKNSQTSVQTSKAPPEFPVNLDEIDVNNVLPNSENSENLANKILDQLKKKNKEKLIESFNNWYNLMSEYYKNNGNTNTNIEQSINKHLKQIIDQKISNNND